jgi:hypothetical protein
MLVIDNNNILIGTIIVIVARNPTSSHFLET